MISYLQETFDKAVGRVAYQSRRLSAGLWRRPAVSAGLLLTPPLGWFIFIYLAALAALFISAFWTVDSFTGEINRHWTLTNFHTILTSDIYRRIAVRTILMAAAVTLTDVLLAFPFAYFMVRLAGPRQRIVLFTLVLVPLWAS